MERYCPKCGRKSLTIGMQICSRCKNVIKPCTEEKIIENANIAKSAKYKPIAVQLREAFGKWQE